MNFDAPVPLMQRESEFAKLLELYRREKPRRVLELGVGHGGSLWYWLREARRDVPVLVVAVDSFSEYDERWRFDDWVPARNVRLEVVKGKTNEFETIQRVFQLSSWFDWVFVDADHSYAAVLADWLVYGRSAKTIVFHDIVSDERVHPEIEVSRLWGELTRDHERTLEIIDDVDAAWGGLGVLWL